MRRFFDVLLRQATIGGGRMALRSVDGTVSYAALVERVRSVSQWAQCLPHRVGSLFSKSVDGIVADLALSYAGKELFPLPDFFSDVQLQHIIRTTGLSHAVTDLASIARATKLGLIPCELRSDSMPNLAPAPDARRVIFTSGTTGAPKGVCLSGGQLAASVASLGRATGAVASDRYLSLLPNSSLLEQIAGVYLPLSVGATIHLPFACPTTLSGSLISSAVEQTKATATVVVPELLAAWVQELRAVGRRASESLRYVAVGGAAVSERLAAAAWENGLPVYEGYGLSECSSVVAVNLPDQRRAGTAGLPIPGVHVAIENGEIIVTGPTVMNGYFGELPASGSWRTGDVGHFDADGFLVVTGRKDNVIVTAAGRNIHPEWIEDVLSADRRIKRSIVVGHDNELAALIVPGDASLCADFSAMRDLVEFAARELPEYAKPRRYLAISDHELRQLNLLTADYRPRRSLITELFVKRSHCPSLPTA